MASALFLGFLVGFPIAASPGPMFFLVLRRTLARGWVNGAISGLGIATGDGLYAALAAFGVTAITSVLISQKRWIGLVGGLAIIAIGAQNLRSRNPLPDPPHKGEGDERQLAVAYASVVGLTLSNPPTILSFAAVFAGLGLHVTTGWVPALMLVVGVFLGSAAWWLILSGVVSAFRAWATPRIAQSLGTVSGGLLIAFGIFTLGSALLR